MKTPLIRLLLAVTAWLTASSPAHARHDGWPTLVAPPSYFHHGYGHPSIHRYQHHYLPRSYAGPSGRSPYYRHFGHKFRYGHGLHGRHDLRARRHGGYYDRHRFARPHYGGSSLFFRFGR